MNKQRFKKFVNISKFLQSTHHNYPSLRTFHVTFALYKRKIVSIGINSTKTHPDIKKLNYSSEEGEDLRNIARTHSELNCILKVKNKLNYKNLKDITFINVRIDKMGNAKYSKPCNGCSDLLKRIGYKNIYYSGECGNFFKY